MFILKKKHKKEVQYWLDVADSLNEKISELKNRNGRLSAQNTFLTANLANSEAEKAVLVEEKRNMLADIERLEEEAKKTSFIPSHVLPTLNAWYNNKFRYGVRYDGKTITVEVPKDSRDCSESAKLEAARILELTRSAIKQMSAVRLDLNGMLKSDELYSKDLKTAMKALGKVVYDLSERHGGRYVDAFRVLRSNRAVVTFGSEPEEGSLLLDVDYVVDKP